MNIAVGPKEDRQLVTGIHTVADVHCGDCREVLGWKYERAYEETQKYKEGKFTLEKSKIAKENGTPSSQYQTPPAPPLSKPLSSANLLDCKSKHVRRAGGTGCSIANSSPSQRLHGKLRRRNSLVVSTPLQPHLGDLGGLRRSSDPERCWIYDFYGDEALKCG
ncbi:hypothetical protein RHMOL_Rhmol02G0310500 [Rhododendron molle]|uniref:Uncharacterized protein n=1 Tax=Rhododendron molle TaxID=49168 RepID=A0ACC0PXH0_RHOML|nr:hypothetical protein RHMOL_Rhmol02G0310500 [Rhododendron molle]